MSINKSVLFNLCLMITAVAAGPVASASKAAPLTPTPCPYTATSSPELALLSWARELVGLKGDGDFRTMASASYLESYYQQGKGLFESGADLYAWDPQCKTLLNHLAHDPRAIDGLRATGYQLERAPYLYSPLIDAIEFWGRQLEYSRQSDDFLPHFARLCQWLNVDFQDAQGRSPLMLATEYGLADLVEILLLAGANPNLQDKQGVTALMFAAQQLEHVDNQREATLQLLLAHGAKVNLQDQSGRSALMLAAQAYSEVGILSLLARGAQPQMQDKQGRRARHYLEAWLKAYADEYPQSLKPKLLQRLP